MDMTDSIIPNSQQVNAEDFLSGPRDVTITGSEEGSSEQPVFFHLAEFPGRTYRPSKSMRRVMVNAWGPESSVYAGRRMTLFRNPKIRFGPSEVGGIEISHLSHIDKPVSVHLMVKRGSRAQFTVNPLAAPTRDDSARLFALFQQHTLDKAAALDLCTQESGRPITSTKDLKPAEITKIIAALTGEEQS